MLVRSVGLTTELDLARTRGHVLDRESYLVVATPDDPSYYFGNLLVLPAPPQVGEVAYWTRRFHDELGGDPAIRHVALRWDGIRGDVGALDELIAAGFRIEVTEVMVATAVAPATTAFPIRELTAADLVASAELEYHDGERHDDALRQFHLRRAAWKQRLLAEGKARFWGAFDGAALVGSLGLVPLGARARYQDVQTAATHRRRGIASALLAAAARGLPGAELVIVAEAGGSAARLYERAGFRTIERIAAACRYPSAAQRPT